MKFKYIRVTRKSDKLCVARFEASHLNKKGSYALWDEVDAKFPREEFVTCLEETQAPMTVFDKSNV